MHTSYNDSGDEIKAFYAGSQSSRLSRSDPRILSQGERTCGVLASRPLFLARQEKGDKAVRWASCALECSTKRLA